MSDNVVPMIRALKGQPPPPPTSDEGSVRLVLLALDLKYMASRASAQEAAKLLSEAALLEAMADRDGDAILEAARALDERLPRAEGDGA